MAVRYPEVRADLVHLVAMLADPERQQREWVNGRQGWEPWADEFYDDLNDGYAAVERADGEIDPYAAVGDTLNDDREAKAVKPLLDLLEVVNRGGADGSLSSCEAAALTLQHPQWEQVVAAARHARAVLDDALPEEAAG